MRTSAGSLDFLTPDLSSVLLAVMAVGAVSLGVVLAVRGFEVVRQMVRDMDHDDSEDRQRDSDD